MNKVMKHISIILLFLVVVPSLAGLAVTLLWNGIVTVACGFAPIGFWQGAGLFVLGQILTGGFILGLFLLGGSIHAAGRRHAGDWHAHWHNMTDEQRREFIERRREYFGFRKRTRTREENAAE